MKKLLYAIAALLILAQVAFAIPPGGGGGSGQPADDDLTTYASITPSANVQTFLGSADYATARTNLGLAIGTNVQAYDANLAALAIANLPTPASNSLVGHTSAGAFANYTAVDLGLTTDYMWLGTASKAAEVATTGTGSVVRSAGAAITPAEVDGHVTSTDLTAAQVSNTVIHNIGQAGEVIDILPTAAAGYSFLVNIGEADGAHFGVEAQATDAIYLIAADGTVTAGDDGAAVVMTAAEVGQSFAYWTFKHTDDYDWFCKAISIGTSTFAAHASTE